MNPEDFGNTCCLLPGKARLFYCRLFPFDFCQAQKGTRSVNKVMMRLEMNASRTLPLYNVLHKAWVLDECSG